MTINDLLDLAPSEKMPVIFIGHGNPMNAISNNGFTRSWHKIGSKLPKAQAIVVISAHWLTEGTHITSAPKNRVIYDFYGFPDQLYKVKYDTEGSERIARELKKSLIKYEALLDSTWGLDHGTWTVLKHLTPEPEVPILQISLDYKMPLDDLVDLFKDLRKLRDRGVIFIGSGNIVHNLAMVDWNNNTFSWAEEFDEITKNKISNHDIKSLINPYKLATSGRLAVPTDDHYRPMLASMALIDKEEELQYFNEDIDLGSIGMRSYITG